jgi:hypothetical protein
MAHTNELIAIATFTHNAGTNRVPGMLGMSSMSSTYYVLHGGLLDAESVIMAQLAARADSISPAACIGSIGW